MTLHSNTFDDDFDPYPFEHDEPLVQKPAPQNYENEADFISHIYQRICDICPDCPSFYQGPLQNACQEAFNTPAIEQRRPLLIYICHDQSIQSNCFCHNIFTKSKMVDYLLDHFIVWAWDVTDILYAERLRDIWRQVFQNEPSYGFDVTQCPQLISVRSLLQYDEAATHMYEATILLKGEKLVRTNTSYTYNSVMDELALVEKEFHENTFLLKRDSVMMSRLSDQVILELMRYLTLTDAIKLFSINILPLLRRERVTLHICDPSRVFSRTILQILEPEQIVSLRLTAIECGMKTDSAVLSRFKNVISLTLVNFQDIKLNHIFGDYFRNLTKLCLWYDSEVDFMLLRLLLSLLPWSILNVEIHCPDYRCYHRGQNRSIEFRRNYRIKNLLLDISNFSLDSFNINHCSKEYESCFFMTLSDFLFCIPRAEWCQLIINEYCLRKLLDWNEVESQVIPILFPLKKVILKVLGAVEIHENAEENMSIIRNRLCWLFGRIVLQVKLA